MNDCQGDMSASQHMGLMSGNGTISHDFCEIEPD
jgi:hypothetical protein